MSTRVAAVFATMLALVSLATTHGSPYEIIDLGAGFEAIGINNAGEVYGVYNGVRGVWADGSWVAIADGSSSRRESRFWFDYSGGINDAGQIAYTVPEPWPYAGYPPLHHGYLWQEGANIQLPAVNGYNSLLVHGINQAGHLAIMAGAVADRVPGVFPDPPEYHAFLYRNGAVVELPDGWQAVAINDHDEILGFTDSGAAIWSESSVTMIIPPASWEALFLKDFNNQRLVVGAAYLSDSRGGPSSWQGFVAIDDDFAVLPSMYPFAINDAGLVVGTTDIFSPTGGSACIWEDDAVIDLNNYIDPSSGWVLSNAYVVNDLGWIVGSGAKSGQEKGFVLIPIPEPIVCVMLMVAGVHLLRRQTGRTTRRSPRG